MTQAIRRRYTRIVKQGSAYNTYLQVGHQSFLIAQQYGYRDSQWFALMLAVALEKLIKENQK